MKEKIKAELDLFKIFVTAVIYSIMGIISYLFINYEKLSNYKITFIFIGIVVIAATAIKLNKVVKAKLKELEQCTD